MSGCIIHAEHYRAGRLRPALIPLCLMFAACMSAADTTERIAAVLNNADRSSADRQRDMTSAPAEILGFIDPGPGMRVLDLLAGEGYYSELLSRLVGETGYVYLHNNQGYIGLQPAAVRRLQHNRLPNVELYVREIGDIMLPGRSLDLVLLNLVYHDFYYRNNGWEVSVDQVFAVIHRLLKPGGSLVVIDHDAPAGTGSGYAQNLHRIERSFAIDDITARGFRLEASTDVLQNPDDTLQRSVFSPELRHKTSRFVLKFVVIE